VEKEPRYSNEPESAISEDVDEEFGDAKAQPDEKSENENGSFSLPMAIEQWKSLRKFLDEWSKKHAYAQSKSHRALWAEIT